MSSFGLSTKRTKSIVMERKSTAGVQLPVFEDADLAFELGGIFFISGERQSGKTSLQGCLFDPRGGWLAGWQQAGTPNFGGLVLGCMDSYDSETRLILQHFSRPT